MNKFPLNWTLLNVAVPWMPILISAGVKSMFGMAPGIGLFAPTDIAFSVTILSLLVMLGAKRTKIAGSADQELTDTIAILAFISIAISMVVFAAGSAFTEDIEVQRLVGEKVLDRLVAAKCLAAQQACTISAGDMQTIVQSHVAVGEKRKIIESLRWTAAAVAVLSIVGAVTIKWRYKLDA